MPARQAGFALLIVLWSLGLLALLVAHLTGTGRADTDLAENLRRAASLQAATDGAVAEAIFHALDSSDRHWPADGTLHAARLVGGTAEIRIDNEAAKINPNAAPPALLAGLLAAVGVEPRPADAIANAIADWHVPDGQIMPGTRDARAGAYRSAGRAYGPAGEPFETLDEIGLVLGVTPAILARIEPHLSVFSDNGPDPRIADSVVREALRAATGNTNQGLPNIAALRRGLGGVQNASNAAPENVITVTALATGADRRRFLRRAVIRLGEGKGGELFHILTWESPAPGA